MEKKDWEKIYKEKGDLRFAVLPKIRRAAGVFKKKGYKKILDLGCGTGKHSIFLAKRGFSVYATDISPSGIEIAKKKAESQGLDIRFSQHDMKNISFSDYFFDAVICTWTIYHGTLEDINQFGRKIARIVFHCFTGNLEQAEIILKRGYYISFTGAVTFRNAEEIRQAAKIVPLDKLMLETDCPYMSPEPIRKQKINEPALLVHTAEFLAQLKGVDANELAEQTTANAKRFFGLPGY